MNSSHSSSSSLTLSNSLGHVHIKGVVSSNGVVTTMNDNSIVCGNVETHQLLKVENRDLEGTEHNIVLDLSDEGERWEGDVLHDQPYGWGVFYGKEGEKVYEGFRIGSMSVCYGRSYYADIGVIEYEGEIVEGKRWGKGILYDRNGVVVYSGKWYDNSQGYPTNGRLECTSYDTMITTVKELTIGDFCCNGIEWVSLKLDTFSQIKKFVVGRNSFCCVENVALNGLPSLEEVTIGGNCFKPDNYSIQCNPYTHFSIANCPILKVISIGCHAFACYSECIIMNNPQLEAIQIGSYLLPSKNFTFSSLRLKRMDGTVIAT